MKETAFVSPQLRVAEIAIIVETAEEKPAMSSRFKPTRPTFLMLAALLALAARPPAAQAAGTNPPPHPSPLTSANSALYIANVGDGSVVRCNGTTGTALSVLEAGSGMVPVGLAFGPDGNLYVTSYGEDCVRRFNPFTGASMGQFIPKGSGGMVAPITMAFGPDGNLYVVTGGVSGDRSDIRRYNGKTGAPLGVFIPHGRGGLVDPGDITFGRDGNLYITNNSANSILRFNGKTGVWLGTFVKPGSGGLKNPQNIAFSPDGDLYAGGDSGVLQFSGKTGAFVRVFAAPNTKLSNVGGLTFGPDGDLYVGDWQKNDVVRYDRRTAAFKCVFVTPKSGLLANRYIVFGPRGAGGMSPAVAAAAHDKRLKEMQAARAAAQASEPALLAAGVAAPEITAVDKDGKTVKLSDFRGKVVVVDFWASWCPPCKASMPHNQEVTKKLQDANVPMVLLAVDNAEAQPAFAQWVKAHPELGSLQFVFADPKTGDVSGKDYHVSGIPTQYVIDKGGIIRASFVGYGEPTDDMEKAVRAAIETMPVGQ